MTGPEYEDLKRTLAVSPHYYLNISPDFDGGRNLWISAEFFRLLREKKRLSFDQSLVYVDACSSAAADLVLLKAFRPKAYFGWEASADAVMSVDAAQKIFDLLPDKARSARDAYWMWRIHAGYLQARSRAPWPKERKPEEVKAYGRDGTAYPPMTAQTVILIYRLRHGPSSATADIRNGMLFVQSCWAQFWSAGKSTGLASPACFHVEFGAHQPTQEEVDDAILEVGGPVQKPFGRWTLAD